MKNKTICSRQIPYTRQAIHALYVCRKYVICMYRYVQHNHEIKLFTRRVYYKHMHTMSIYYVKLKNTHAVDYSLHTDTSLVAARLCERWAERFRNDPYFLYTRYSRALFTLKRYCITTTRWRQRRVFVVSQCAAELSFRIYIHMCTHNVVKHIM